MTSAKYHPRQYWEDRLRKDFSLSGVGFQGLGTQYNRWLYRARLRALGKLLKESRIDPRGRRILDVGVGTGFYVDYWKKAGAAVVVGIDITQKSVLELRHKYPEYRFLNADISCLGPDVLDEKFDIITAFDVLFHIVDEAKFRQALKNMARLSHQNTCILVFDSFLKEAIAPAFHESDRTMERYKTALDNAALKPVVTLPVFYLMSNPIDKARLDRRLARALLPRVWALISRLPLLVARVRPLGEAVGYLLGLMLYAMDGIVLRHTPIGPGIKAMLVHMK